MADTETITSTSTSNEEESFDNKNIEEQIVNRDIEESLINEDNNTNSSINSCSVYSTLTQPEEKEEKYEKVTMADTGPTTTLTLIDGPSLEEEKGFENKNIEEQIVNGDIAESLINEDNNNTNCSINSCSVYSTLPQPEEEEKYEKVTMADTGPTTLTLNDGPSLEEEKGFDNKNIEEQIVNGDIEESLINENNNTDYCIINSDSVYYSTLSQPEKGGKVSMADTVPTTLTSNDDRSLEEEEGFDNKNIEEQILNGDIEKSLINENNNTNYSINSCSVGTDTDPTLTLNDYRILEEEDESFDNNIDKQISNGDIEESLINEDNNTNCSINSCSVQSTLSQPEEEEKEKYEKVTMADTDPTTTLTLNDDHPSLEEEKGFENKNIEEQIVSGDIEESLINDNNNNTNCSINSGPVQSTLPQPEHEEEEKEENVSDVIPFNDSSGCRNLTRAESLRNGGGNCDLCKMKSLQSPGNFYCRYCDKCFCESCISFHEGLSPGHSVANLLDDTVVLSMKDVTPVSTCDEHKLPITLFCDECHLCLCVACWERHNTGGDGQKKITTCPSPVPLDSIATEKRTQGDAMLESLASFKDQAVRQSESLDGIMSELIVRSDKKCESLWNELEVLFTSLRHRLTQLISQIQAETYYQKSKLQRKSVSWKAYIRDVEGAQSKLDELLRYANDADLVSAFKDIKTKKESLDIDKFVPMMGVCPISVGVEYSKDYLNLHRNVPSLVLGKPHLSLGSTGGDTSCQKSLDQILTESRTDVGIQCDEKDLMQSNVLSNPFFDEDYFQDLNMGGNNLNLESKDCRSPVNKNITSIRNLHYLYNKDFFTRNDSGVSGNNSLRSSSFTTCSDISSPQSDFDISACTNNVASPINSGGDPLSERDNNLTAAREVESRNTDFTPRQMPILKTSSQWSLLLEKNTYVRGLTLTEDDHVFVCDRSSKKITQFDPNGKLMYRCDVSGIPWDICAFSNSVLFVTLPQKSKMLRLQRCTGKCLLAVGLAMPTGKKKYVSLTKVSCGMLACDNEASVDLLDSNGEVLRSICSSIVQTGLDASHRICSGQVGDTFWTLNVTLKTISCHRIDGELLIYHRIAFRESTSDICSDCYNCIYGCDKERIYCLTQEGGENILWTFKQELKNHPRMCVNSTRDKLFVSYLSGNKNVLQIFNISPKFVLVNSISN